MSPGDDPPPSDEAPFRSRSDSKRERVATETALAELSERLLTVSAKVLAALELGDDVLEAVEQTRRIQSQPARGRALRRVRSTLRDTDWLTLLRRLDGLAAGIAPASLSESEAARQAALLSAQGEPGLSRFMEQFPHADRRRLRQLMQNVRRSPEAKREKVRRQLEALIQAEMDGSPLPEDHAGTTDD